MSQGKRGKKSFNSQKKPNMDATVDLDEEMRQEMVERRLQEDDFLIDGD